MRLGFQGKSGKRPPMVCSKLSSEAAETLEIKISSLFLRKTRRLPPSPTSLRGDVTEARSRPCKFWSEHNILLLCTYLRIPTGSLSGLLVSRSMNIVRPLPLSGHTHRTDSTRAPQNPAHTARPALRWPLLEYTRATVVTTTPAGPVLCTRGLRAPQACPCAESLKPTQWVWSPPAGSTDARPAWPAGRSPDRALPSHALNHEGFTRRQLGAVSLF